MKRSIDNCSDNSVKRGLFAVILASLVVPGPGDSAMGQTREGRQLVVAKLISDAVNTESPFTVGIRFTLQPNWYLYWRNPGDAGLPIEVKWELPEGWSADEIRLPIPSKFVHDDVTAYGYKNEVVLLTTIRPGSAEGPVKASLDWLVCRESCLRGGTSVSLDISSQSAEDRKEAAAVMARFSSRLPGTQKASGVLIQEARLKRQGTQWTAEIDLVGAKAVKDFYPDLLEGVFPDFKSIRVDQGTLTIAFTLQDESMRRFSLKGLLVTNDSAYEIQIPMLLPPR